MTESKCNELCNPAEGNGKTSPRDHGKWTTRSWRPAQSPTWSSCHIRDSDPQRKGWGPDILILILLPWRYEHFLLLDRHPQVSFLTFWFCMLRSYCAPMVGVRVSFLTVKTWNITLLIQICRWLLLCLGHTQHYSPDSLSVLSVPVPYTRWRFSHIWKSSRSAVLSEQSWLERSQFCLEFSPERNRRQASTIRCNYIIHCNDRHQMIPFFFFKEREILTFHQSSLESSRRVIMSPGLGWKVDELGEKAEGDKTTTKKMLLKSWKQRFFIYTNDPKTQTSGNEVNMTFTSSPHSWRQPCYILSASNICRAVLKNNS